MQYVNDKRSLFNTFHLDCHQLRWLDQTWVPIFQRDVIPALPVAAAMALFCANNGRPTVDLRMMLGLTILQQAFNYTDNETLEAFFFNEQVRQALNVYDLPESKRTLCLKTLWSFRSKMLDAGLEDQVFSCVTLSLARAFEVKTGSQRLDSVHVNSNMKIMSRLNLFVKVIQNFLLDLGKDLIESVFSGGMSLPERRLSKDQEKAGSFYHYFGGLKPDDRKKRLVEVAQDLCLLVKMFAEDSAMSELQSYKDMARVLAEQCEPVEPDSGGQGFMPVQLKEPKSVGGGVMQNPSDGTATFSGHKGAGYSAQIMETFTDRRGAEGSGSEDGEWEEGPDLNLVTYVHVHPAHIHDCHALLPALEGAAELGMTPDELLADTAYGSDANWAAAAEEGVALVSPAGGKDPEAGEGARLASFKFDENDAVAECPEGQKPWHVQRGNNGTVAAGFDKDVCSGCRFFGNCATKIKGDVAELHYSAKDLRLSRRRAQEREPKFGRAYSMRAGVEATNSQADRLTGIKKSRYRGLRRLQFATTLKMVGLNIRRAALVYSAKRRK
jgi:hypothetical protein